MSLILSDLVPRCHNCNKLLAEKVTRPWVIRCGRCKCTNYAPTPGEARTLVVEITPTPVGAITPNHGTIDTEA